MKVPKSFKYFRIITSPVQIVLIMRREKSFQSIFKNFLIIHNHHYKKCSNYIAFQPHFNSKHKVTILVWYRHMSFENK
jgi:hypothetical protein